MNRQLLWSAFTLCVAAAASPGHALECSVDHVIAMTGEAPTTFTVEIADTPERQAQGLMFRPHLPREAGMLFIMDPPRPANFWMRNTMISLDLLFVEPDGRVQNIAARAVPFSEERLSSHDKVRAVLEINGGLAEELGIAPGTQLVHPIFHEAAPEFLCTQ